jgi:hypothetical protein
MTILSHSRYRGQHQPGDDSDDNRQDGDDTTLHNSSSTTTPTTLLRAGSSRPACHAAPPVDSATRWRHLFAG